MLLGRHDICLVDGDGGVNNFWNDCLLVNDGLDTENLARLEKGGINPRLVNMMMNVFVRGHWQLGLCALSRRSTRGILELGCLCGKLLLGLLLITMLEHALFHW